MREISIHMKKILLLVLPLLAFGFYAQAQVTYNAGVDTAYFNLMDDDTEHKAKMTVTNAGSSPVDIRWRVTGYTLPGPLWESNGLCDWVTCVEFEDAGDSTTSALPANSTQDMFVGMKRKAGAVTGCSQIVVELWEAGNASNSATVVFVHSSGADKSQCGAVTPISTANFVKSDLVTVYPNPTSSYLNLNVLSNEVKSVELSNLIGKQISKINMTSNGSSVHQLSLQALPKGMYILQFKNAGGKTLGVQRITKQ